MGDRERFLFVFFLGGETVQTGFVLGIRVVLVFQKRTHIDDLFRGAVFRGYSHIRA